MKRSLIAAGLLLSVMVICCLGYNFLNSTTDDIIALSDTALKYAEENNTEPVSYTHLTLPTKA